MSWTETLNDRLAVAGRGGSWLQVEPDRTNGWLFLAEATETTGPSWFRLGPDEQTPKLLDIRRDRRIRGMAEAEKIWQERNCRIDLLAWRPGRRAVFRVSDDAGTRICKIYRRVDRIVERWTSFAPELDSWSAPKIIEWDDEFKMLSTELCPGRSLHSRWFAGEGRVEDANSLVELLGLLHSSPMRSELKSYEVDDEIRVLDRRMEILTRAVATPRDGLAETRDSVVRALRTISRQRSVLCHRDLHDKQILTEGDRNYLIDFDLAAAGPPGLDAGNLLAHVRLRQLQGAPLPWGELIEQLIRGYSRLCTVAGLNVWTAAALCRLALLYRLRRRPAGLVANLLNSSNNALTRRGEWSTIG